MGPGCWHCHSFAEVTTSWFNCEGVPRKQTSGRAEPESRQLSLRKDEARASCPRGGSGDQTPSVTQARSKARIQAPNPACCKAEEARPGVQDGAQLSRWKQHMWLPPSSVPAGIWRKEAVMPFVCFATLELQDNCTGLAKTHRALAGQVVRAEVGQHTAIVSADRQGTKAFSARPRARGGKRYARKQWCSQHTEHSTRRAFCSLLGIPSIHHL